MPNERQHAKIISFVDWSQRFYPAPPLDVPALQAAMDRLKDITIRIQRDPFGPAVYEHTILKNRDTPGPVITLREDLPPVPYVSGKTTFNVALEARKRVREAARAAPPTAWDHLLRDEGLG